jgi:hypothetical protein
LKPIEVCAASMRKLWAAIAPRVLVQDRSVSVVTSANWRHVRALRAREVGMKVEVDTIVATRGAMPAFSSHCLEDQLNVKRRDRGEAGCAVATEGRR